MHGTNKVTEILSDTQLRTLDSEIGQVFGSAKATGQNDRIKIIGIGFRQLFDVTSSQSCRFHQHIAGFTFSDFTRHVIDHMQLLNIRCKTLNLRTSLIKAKQGNHAFVNF